MIYRRRVFKVLADPELPVSKDGSAGDAVYMPRCEGKCGDAECAAAAEQFLSAGDAVNDTGAELSQSQEDLPSEETPNDASE